MALFSNIVNKVTPGCKKNVVKKKEKHEKLWKILVQKYIYYHCKMRFGIKSKRNTYKTFVIYVKTVES